MADEITLTIPRDPDFLRVAHLVIGGLAVRLNLTIENLEDMQIAVDAVLAESEVDDDVTMTLCLRNQELETTLSPVDGHVRARFEHEDAGDAALGLRRVLGTVVDDVAFEGDTVRLRKKVRVGG